MKQSSLRITSKEVQSHPDIKMLIDGNFLSLKEVQDELRLIKPNPLDEINYEEFQDFMGRLNKRMFVGIAEDPNKMVSIGGMDEKEIENMTEDDMRKLLEEGERLQRRGSSSSKSDKSNNKNVKGFSQKM